jgi:hypothetical protein
LIRGTLAIEDTGKVTAWADALIGPTSLPGKYSELVNDPVIWLSTALAPEDDAIPSLVPALLA